VLGGARACDSSHDGSQSAGGGWLRPHIRVRIIDKHLKGGKYYLKKARVVDVVHRGVCTLQVPRHTSRLGL